MHTLNSPSIWSRLTAVQRTQVIAILVQMLLRQLQLIERQEAERS